MARINKHVIIEKSLRYAHREYLRKILSRGCKRSCLQARRYCCDGGTFRNRVAKESGRCHLFIQTSLPKTITEKALDGYEWIIRAAGRAQYKFVLTKEANFAPNPNLAKTKILDATPGIVSRYSFDDEQALLARIRYNRLLDIFTGVTCYSLQNHLRTTVPNVGQVETDEIYV